MATTARSARTCHVRGFCYPELREIAAVLARYRHRVSIVMTVRDSKFIGFHHDDFGMVPTTKEPVRPGTLALYWPRTEY